jgi:hypothetical protein
MTAAHEPVFSCVRCGHLLGTEPNTDYPESMGVIRLLKLCACDDHECAAEFQTGRSIHHLVRLEGYTVPDEPPPAPKEPHS